MEPFLGAVEKVLTTKSPNRPFKTNINIEAHFQTDPTGELLTLCGGLSGLQLGLFLISDLLMIKKNMFDVHSAKSST